MIDFIVNLWMRIMQFLFICAVIFLITVGITAFQYSQDTEFQKKVWNSGIPNNEISHDL